MPDAPAELCYMGIAEAARHIAARRLSPLEYTDALLQRIAALDPQLDAFITVTAERARSQARQAEAEIAAGRYRGPLHGIPFALKDIYETRGILTSGGSRICLGNIPTQDATTVRRLEAAGTVLLGKLQTHEFALGGPSFDLPWPPARNPWHLEHFTGGSSSGSGAALAGGLVPASLGSDTGGSIRGPASLCGLAGLMPSSGMVSRAGVMPNSFTLDHCGPMARTVEDCAILLQAIAGHDPLDAGSVAIEVPDYRATLDDGVKGLRVGVLRHYWEEDMQVHPDLARAMDEAIGVFRRLGATVEHCRTRPLRESLDTKLVIAGCELLSIHYDDFRSRPGDFGRDFLGRVLPSCVYQASDYLQATREHRRFDEATVLRAGHAYQRATDWHLQHPRLATGTPQPAVSPRYSEPQLPDMDAMTHHFVLDSARRAGLVLDDVQTAILLETAPFAMAVAERLRKPRHRSEEPALVFRVPGH